VRSPVETESRAVRAGAEPKQAVLRPPRRTVGAPARRTAAAPPAVSRSVGRAAGHVPVVRARAETHVGRAKAQPTYAAPQSQTAQAAQRTRGPGHVKHSTAAAHEPTRAHAKNSDVTKSNNGHHNVAVPNPDHAKGQEEHPESSHGKDKP
jgi:hypothetical protein